MGYRDDFYTAKNIVGHTGNLHNNPTVYFLKLFPNDDAMFGHITQDHDDKSNIGRGAVEIDPDYHAENQWNGTAWEFVEYIGDDDFHTSRTAFVSIDDLDAAGVAILRGSISRFPLKKRFDSKNYSDQIFSGRPAGAAPLRVAELVKVLKETIADEKAKADADRPRT